jgi:hypothetical protein
VRTVRAGSKPCPDRLRPGRVFALRHLDGDVDILGGVVARAADALDDRASRSWSQSTRFGRSATTVKSPSSKRTVPVSLAWACRSSAARVA